MSIRKQYYVTSPEAKPRHRGFKLQSCEVVEPGGAKSEFLKCDADGSHLRNLMLATEVPYYTPVVSPKIYVQF